jgi:hypothetical protein
VALGEFWTPIIERVREVEMDHGSRWSEAAERLVHVASTPSDAAEHLLRKLARERRSAVSGGSPGGHGPGGRPGPG